MKATRFWKTPTDQVMVMAVDKGGRERTMVFNCSYIQFVNGVFSYHEHMDTRDAFPFLTELECSFMNTGFVPHEWLDI